MANILWPEDLCPATFSMPLRVDMRAHPATFGGSERVIDMLDDVWMAELSIDIRQGVAAGRLEGLVNWLNGGRDTASLWHFARPVPNGTLRGSPVLLNPAGKGAAELVLGAVAGQTLRAGDMLGIGGLLVQVGADCVANASGVITVPLVNRLRRAVAGLTRASTATYIDSGGVLRIAFVGEPRFQGGALLVEDESTNLLSRSQELTAAAWLKSNASVSLATLSGPNSDWEANKIVPNTVSGSHYIVRTFGVIAGEQYTFSAFAQAGEYAFVGILFASAGFGTNSVDVFDLSSGVVVTNASGGARIEPLAGGLYRCSSTRVASASSSSQFQLRVFPTSSAGAYAGDDVSGLHVFGCQLEVGEVSSYIPTDTTTVTRAADAVTPVVWDRPTGTFRLQNLSTLGHGTTYSDTVTLSFEENIYG